jgi:hypothetical protein
MKQGREFDNILDDCLERIVLKGEALDYCLRLYPQQATELKPLLETVQAVKTASAVEPRPEFKARARYQFRSALGEKAAPKGRPFFGWLPRWATALAIVLVLLVAGGGTVAAAGNSMPDSILYPVKLATENVQMSFTFSDLDKAQLCAELADERVAEIIYMAEKGDAQGVEAVTQRLETRLATLAELASGLEGTDAGALLSVTSGGAEEPAAPVVPPVTVPAEEGGWGGNRAQDQAGFKATVADAAQSHADSLRAMLDSVPASVRSALEEAIEVSENGYAQVLAALE